MSRIAGKEDLGHALVLRPGIPGMKIRERRRSRSGGGLGKSAIGAERKLCARSVGFRFYPIPVIRLTPAETSQENGKRTGFPSNAEWSFPCCGFAAHSFYETRVSSTTTV